VVAGLLLATVAWVVISSTAGSWTDGGYCSPFGQIGRYEAPDAGKMVVYLDEGSSGFPPRDSCSVFLIDAIGANSPVSAEEALHRGPPPHHLLAHGSYPQSQERHWIVGLLVMPSAIWCLFVVATGLRTRRTTAATR
jgi:hypothetical protein